MAMAARGIRGLRLVACRPRPLPLGARPYFKPSETVTQGLVDSIIRSDSAWVDRSTTVVEDPLHPNGFDFAVDLSKRPAQSSGVAAFAAGPLSAGKAPDPFDLVEGEITSLSDGIRQLLGCVSHNAHVTPPPPTTDTTAPVCIAF